MLYGKINKIIWGILLLICFIGSIATTKDMLFLYIFIVGSGIVFSLDYRNIEKQYHRNKQNIMAIKKWHIYANMAQWIFWISVLYLLCISERSIGYKAFIIGDLFLVATFATIKYKKQVQKSYY